MTEYDESSAFHPDNVQQSILITLTRIYDVLITQLHQTNPEKAGELSNLHSQGILLAPPPSAGADLDD